MAGLDFTRITRNGQLDEARWDEPWLVVWDGPGYAARFGLYRVLSGMHEERVKGGKRSGPKIGYDLRQLPDGVYLVRTAYADRWGQHEHRLLWHEGQWEPLSLEQMILWLVRYGA